MRNARFVVRPRARWWVLLLAALLLAGCASDGSAPDSSQQPLEQQSADDESDAYYVETPEDCLADEEFDPVDQLCYVVVDCEAAGDCAEEGAGFAQTFLDALDEIVWDFVSDYAATAPAEDIAESFAAFVLKPAPSGDTVADRKVAFFYDYPELVKLRAEISGRLVSRLRRN